MNGQAARGDSGYVDPSFYRFSNVSQTHNSLVQFLCHLPLVLSWSFVLVHTFASSPPLRRFLSRRSQRSAAIILNSPIVILSAGLTAAIFVPAMQQGQVMIDSQKNYIASMAIIEAAKVQANPLMLAALAPNIQAFGESIHVYHRHFQPTHSRHFAHRRGVQQSFTYCRPHRRNHLHHQSGHRPLHRHYACLRLVDGGAKAYCKI